jgi:hypothetical protein
MMTELYQQAVNPKSRLVLIPNGDHNDTWAQKNYMEHIKQFVSEVLTESDIGNIQT